MTKHRRTRTRVTLGGREEFIFKKSFDLSYRNPENARCAWELETLLRTKLKRDITFHKVSARANSWTRKEEKRFETFEDGEIFQVRRTQKIMRRSDSGHWITVQNINNHLIRVKCKSLSTSHTEER
jgi:hypothetical protein